MPVPYFGGVYGTTKFEFVNQKGSWFAKSKIWVAEQILERKLKDEGFRDGSFANNPITGQPSCPFGFESVLLYESNFTLYAKDKFLFGLDYELVWVCYFGRLNSF